MTEPAFTGTEPGAEPEADGRMLTKALILGGDPEAVGALVAGLPVHRSRLAADTLRALGEPLEGPDVTLDEELALRLGVAFPRPAEGQEAEEAPFRIEVYSAKDLCALPLPHENPELVGPFIRRGRITLLGATTGHGKTTLGCQMLAAAVLGGVFLGWEVEGGLRVLVLDLEQHLEDIQEQLAAVGLADSELLDYAPVPEGLTIDRDAEQLRELERIVSAKPYDIVRVDPFYKLHGADSSEEKEARPLVALTRRWVNEHGFGLLMDTHTRKRIEGRNSFMLDDLFGSSLFSRDPEVVLGLQLVEDGFSRLHVFKARGRRGELRAGQKIELLYNDAELFRRKPEKEERDLRAEILALAEGSRAYEWRTVKEWAGPREKGGVGAGEDAVRFALDGLAAERLFAYSHEAAIHGRREGAKCWRANCDEAPTQLNAVVAVSSWGEGSNCDEPPTAPSGAGGVAAVVSPAAVSATEGSPDPEEVERLRERHADLFTDDADAAGREESEQ